MYGQKRPRGGLLFVCIAFVCLLSSAALVVSIVAATRDNAVDTSPSPTLAPPPGSTTSPSTPTPPPSGPTPLPTPIPNSFSIDTTCEESVAAQQDNQLAITFAVSNNGNPASGIPYSSITFDPDDLVILNTALTPTFTDENGVLRVFVDTTPQTGSVAISTVFEIEGQSSAILCEIAIAST